MIFVWLAAVVALVACADDFCGSRCDIDSQCTGGCAMCRTLTNATRVCVRGSDCGDECSSDRDCALSACNSCVSGRCSGLPCRAACNDNSFCSSECGVCRPSQLTNQMVCTDPCGAECRTALDCGGSCDHCNDGVCGTPAQLSAGAVAGIALASGVVMALLLAIFAIVIVVKCCDGGSNDVIPESCWNLAIFLVFGTSIACVVTTVTVGLALGLSPSICC